MNVRLDFIKEISDIHIFLFYNFINLLISFISEVMHKLANKMNNMIILTNKNSKRITSDGQ